MSMFLCLYLGVHLGMKENLRQNVSRLVHRRSDLDVVLAKHKHRRKGQPYLLMFFYIISESRVNYLLILREQMDAFVGLIVAQCETTNSDPVLRKQ